MSYLLDKNKKIKKYKKVSAIIFVAVVLIYFRAGIFGALSNATHFIFRPVIVLGNNIGEKFSNVGAYFKNKRMIVLKNEELEAQIAESVADRANYASVLDENNKMKEILGRKDEKMNLILAGILSKPNQSIYDTLVIDAGMNQGLKIGDRVFALGNVPIGRVAEVYANSSNVILFSNPGEKTDVVISNKPIVDASGATDTVDIIVTKNKNIYLPAVGRGGGNFEVVLPKDFILDIGSEADLPGVNSYILGTVATIISDPRDSFQKALLVSPVNVQELKFVEVEI